MKKKELLDMKYADILYHKNTPGVYLQNVILIIIMKITLFSEEKKIINEKNIWYLTRKGIFFLIKLYVL
jgi:hypothetical protein